MVSIPSKQGVKHQYFPWLDEIRENDYNLNIALYVDTTEPEEDIDVEEELANLRELQAERDEIEAQMTQHMEALNYE